MGPPALRAFAAVFAVVLLLIAIALAVPGCASPPGPEDRVVAAWNKIVEDGKVTPAESESFAAVLRDAIGTETRIDWPMTLGSAAGAILTSFLGVNAYRNSRERKVWGPPPAQGAGSGLSPGIA